MGCVWVCGFLCVGLWVFVWFFVREVGGVAIVGEINCEDKAKAEWRRAERCTCLIDNGPEAGQLQEPFHMVIWSGSAGLRSWIVDAGNCGRC